MLKIFASIPFFFLLILLSSGFFMSSHEVWSPFLSSVLVVVNFFGTGTLTFGKSAFDCRCTDMGNVLQHCQLLLVDIFIYLNLRKYHKLFSFGDFVLPVSYCCPQLAR